MCCGCFGGRGVEGTWIRGGCSWTLALLSETAQYMTWMVATVSKRSLYPCDSRTTTPRSEYLTYNHVLLNKCLCQVHAKCQIHFIKVPVPFREALTGTLNVNFQENAFGRVSWQFVLSKEVLLFLSVEEWCFLSLPFKASVNFWSHFKNWLPIS